jgi:hypothetical protein
VTEAFPNDASEPAPAPPSAPTSALHKVAHRLAGCSDARLVALAALSLFALSAWPLLLVDLPPLQDLPNHVATAHIIAHPALYPQIAFNGFFRSNTLLTLWLVTLGRFGLFAAAKAFVALVLATGAIALPVFVLRFAGRSALPIAMLLAWPLVHGFFVSMGFLNFAFAFALSLLLLVLIDRQRTRPGLTRGLGIAALAVLIWYAHPFPLAVVVGLVALHCLGQPTWRERRRSGHTLLGPLVPAGLLVLVPAYQHLVKAEHAPEAVGAAFAYLNPWELLIHFWSDASGSFTRWGLETVIPAILLPWLAWRQRGLERTFFTKRALQLLVLLYLALPVMMSNWWYLHCRLIPFLWAGLLIRLPSALPRRLAPVLAVCALGYSATLGVDYARLDHDRAELTAGVSAVPEQATLLPLLFKHSKTSDFTASLSHDWAYYTVEKSTSAPLVFAVERSYPITYRKFPPTALIPPMLDRFARNHATPSEVCKLLRAAPSEALCVSTWSALWSDFWRQAEPRFTHVLTWAMPPETRTRIPASYRRIFAAGDLEIYQRRDPGTRPTAPLSN